MLTYFPNFVKLRQIIYLRVIFSGSYAHDTALYPIEDMESAILQESNVHDSGTGPALVLLHGLGGTWSIWKPVITLLESRFRVIVPTLPGHHGGVPLPPGTEPTVDAMADTLIDLLRARNIESAHVAGNSLGGWLALELARRGFARSVTAFSPAGGWRTVADYRKVALTFRVIYFLLPLLIALTTLFLGKAWVRRILGRSSMEHGDRVPEKDFREMLRGMSGNRVLLGLLKTMGRDGPITPMAAGKIPICIAWGECDQVIPFERYGQPMLERISGAEQRTIYGVGHVPMYDDPQALSKTIIDVTSPLDSGQTMGAL
jgi:pimeloyl-ACP methyl ester carboxylesterase